MRKNVVFFVILVVLLFIFSGCARQEEKSTGGRVEITPRIPVSEDVLEVSVDDDPVLGDVSAPVTIVEFSDFQCPYCGQFFKETLPELEEKYVRTGKVKLVYRDFPLEVHAMAHVTAQAAECADEQGRFWEFHDVVFEMQGVLSEQALFRFAQDVGLDVEAFRTCLSEERYKEEVDKDIQDGIAYGVSGTPTFFVNNVMITGAQPFSAFEVIIEQMLNN